MYPPDGSEMFFLDWKKICCNCEALVAYLTRFACDLTLAWSTIAFDHCSLAREMTRRGPAKIFAQRDHGPLLARVLVGVVTAPVEFSIFCAHRGIVPRSLGDRVAR